MEKNIKITSVVSWVVPSSLLILRPDWRDEFEGRTCVPLIVAFAVRLFSLSGRGGGFAQPKRRLRNGGQWNF